LYVFRVEIVRVKADCSQLTGALESILAQRGYRTLRSFDLPLNSATDAVGECGACAERRSGACACRYAVLLVFPYARVSSAEAITIQGRGERSTVTLLTYNEDSELTSQFPLLLIEALQVFPGAEAQDGKSSVQTNSYVL
jgi:hypothetical protein